MAKTQKSVEDFIFRGEKTGTVQVASLTDIKLPDYQPRQYFDETKLEELTQTIRKHGVLEPLLVRKLPGKNQYELVAGGRRYRAAKKAALTEVPVVVRELSDSLAIEIALIENLQRENLNPIEETEGILKLLSQRLNIKIEEISPLLHLLQKQLRGRSANNVIGSQMVESVLEVFNSLGLMELDSFISNRLPLLNLPEDILEAVRAGKIKYTKAKAIARLSERETRTQLLEVAIANSLSLSQIRQLVKAEQTPKQQSELKTRLDTTYKQVKKAKKLWSDVEKRKQLESLLLKLEKLIE